jgi:gamma-aminobutyric acid type B receptor
VNEFEMSLWFKSHLCNNETEIDDVKKVSKSNFNFFSQVEVCQSLHTKSWLGILYAYKGLLLVVGVYMAWETRHVKIPALNDSQYIGFSVYGAVITSVSVVVLANLISEQVTLAFIIITSIILTSTTATLCLVFLPKMRDIRNITIQRHCILFLLFHSVILKLN